MRHASPARVGPDGSDFTRPLTIVGVQEALKQGAILKERTVRIDRVLCSSAARAEETAHHFISGFSSKPELVVDHHLYNAPGDQIYDLVKNQPDSVTSLLLIAHMPGVAEAVYMMCTNPNIANHPFMPATMMGLEFPISSWAEINPASAQLHSHLPPPAVSLDG